MYQFAIKFYFVGCEDLFSEVARTFNPMPGFRHEFKTGSTPDPENLAWANVVFVSSALGNGQLASILDARHKHTQIIVLQQPEDVFPENFLVSITDLWKLPLSASEFAFHFIRWQKNFKNYLDLWETRQFLEILMNTSPDMVWFKSANGIHEIVNDMFCSTVKKPRDDVQGQKHAYIWNVEYDDPACLESERIVMDSGKTHVFEEVIDTGEGKRQLTTYKSPLYDVEGSIMGTIGIGVDVTKEREYQAKILESNKTLETIFTTMDCGILCHTLDGGRVISANRAALELLDFSTSAELASSFQMVASSVMDEDKPKLRTAISQLKNVGDSVSYEYRIAHRDGRVIHVMGTAKLIQQDGEIICQRFLLDCTAQKLAQEKEKRERERRHEDLVRALGIDYQLICVLDPATNDYNVLQLLEYPYKNLTHIFGGSGPLSEKIDTFIKTCVHPEDRDAMRHAFSIDVLGNELRHQKIYYLNFRVLSGDDVHYFQLKAVRTGEPNGPAGIVIGLQSVDSRTRKELEHNSQLAEALKLARKANNAKTIFLSNMSHDIRTPMNAVVGYTTLALQNLENPPKVEGFLNKILFSGKHLINLINDILDMSYIESGKIQLEEKPCNLDDIMSELWNIVQPNANAKNQTLSLDMEKVTDREVYCDRLRLNQILLNLVGNAIKYTPDDGKIDVTIRQFNCPRPHHALYEFRVRDNGIGMSPEFLCKIFEPFERARNSTVAGIEGTGLGMAITKNIVNMMKGEISVQSIPEKGSEFVFRIVFGTCATKKNSDSQNLPDHVDAKENTGDDSATQARNIHILLAEDNAMNQEIACEFLTSANYNVDVANNGKEAVDMLMTAGAGHYDIVLMDVQMPVMDGYQATSIIRSLRNAELANIPIIAMTANSFEEDRQEALMRGMNRHIAKPIDFAVLFKTISELLPAPDKGQE